MGDRVIIQTQPPNLVVVGRKIINVVEVSMPGIPGRPGAAGTADFTVRLEAGENLGGQRAVIVGAGGLLYYASCLNPAHYNRVLGVTAGAISAGAEGDVKAGGSITEPTWAWDLDKFIYLGDNGLLTQNPPASGFLLQMGWPLTVDTMIVDIKIPIFFT